MKLHVTGQDPVVCPCGLLLPLLLFLFLLDDKSTYKSPKTSDVADAITAANEDEIPPPVTEFGSDSVVETNFGSFIGMKQPVESSRMTWNRKNPCTCFVPKCSVLIEMNLNSTVLTEYGPSLLETMVDGLVDAVIVVVVVPVGAVGTTMPGVTLFVIVVVIVPSSCVVVCSTGLDDIPIPVFRFVCETTTEDEGIG